MNGDRRPTRWRKSSYSSNGASNCVEIGRVSTAAAVRDSKDRDAGFLAVSATRWTDFLTAIKHGRFDG